MDDATGSFCCNGIFLTLVPASVLGIIQVVLELNSDQKLVPYWSYFETFYFF